MGVKKKKLMKKVICSHCGKELKDEKETCPRCGGDAHAITMEINEAVEIPQCIQICRIDEKRHNKEKDRRTMKMEDSYSVNVKKYRNRWMDIDRDKDSYLEIVQDKETGEIVHYCAEPLSQHQGHGSAKRKK